MGDVVREGNEAVPHVNVLVLVLVNVHVPENLGGDVHVHERSMAVEG